MSNTTLRFLFVFVSLLSSFVGVFFFFFQLVLSIPVSQSFGSDFKLAVTVFMGSLILPVTEHSVPFPSAAAHLCGCSSFSVVLLLFLFSFFFLLGLFVL